MSPRLVFMVTHRGLPEVAILVNLFCVREAVGSASTRSARRERFIRASHPTHPARGGQALFQPGVGSWAKAESRSSARRAAACSASFLLLPAARAYDSSPIVSSTSKVLSWSGPDSDTTR